MFSVVSQLVLFVYFCVGFQQTIAQVSEGVPCETPNGEYGNCINIKSCTKLVNLLINQSNNQEVRNFLRSSTCGYVGSTPLVCCPPTTTRNANPFDEATKPTDTTEASGKKYQLPRSPDCGKSANTNPRVVNGVPAKLGEFPWIVALGYRNSKNPEQPKWLCGGSLITKKHVLTAGHCVHGRQDLYLARVGELDLYTDDDGAHPQDIPLINAKIHEDYSPVVFTNDIAILTLQSEPTVANVWPICLPIDEPLRSKNYVRSNPIVTGWGSVYFHGPSSSILKLAAIPVVDNDQCKRAYANKSVIDDRVLCAGYVRGGKDACEGDSGGPFAYGMSNGADVLFYQIGVVSYGFRCAEAGYPGVYSRVTAFLEWIQRNLN